jgi:hypothetical protein
MPSSHMIGFSDAPAPPAEAHRATSSTRAGRDRKRRAAPLSGERHLVKLQPAIECPPADPESTGRGSLTADLLEDPHDVFALHRIQIPAE